MKKTVIGTDIRGTSDLIRDGVGILVPPCDPNALAEAMIKSIDFQPNDKQRLAILEACSLPKIIQQHETLYRSLIESGN